MLECVVNISEGADKVVLAELANIAGPSLLDVHCDRDHNRSVFTLAGPQVEYDIRRLAQAAASLLDITSHAGVHPRIGAVDVVPFVPLGMSHFPSALLARDSFAQWFASELSVPCFLYGPERTLPQVRREAFISLEPDFGPSKPHPFAGACAVGARNVLVAYNIWLEQGDLETAKRVARAIRTPGLRTLGLWVDNQPQVSCNLTEPEIVGPAQAFDQVAKWAKPSRAELVGLLPASVLAAIPRHRWSSLDIGERKTIEYRLWAKGNRRSQQANDNYLDDEH